MASSPRNTGFDTVAVHGGQNIESAADSVTVPIYATSTYAQMEPNNNKGYDYGRFNNPTRLAFEKALAAIENGKYAFAFGSGMAAIDTIISLLDAGSHLIATDDIYGGTYQLFNDIRGATSNLSADYVDMTNINAIAQAIKPNTKMIWIESPTNPLLKIVDIQAVSDLAHNHGALVAVDNTFASPWTQNPLELGADIVMHSTTKYINGHSDMLGGAVIVNDDGLAKRIKLIEDRAGAVPSPFDCFLAHRGLKTLGLRMQRHCETTLALAKWLEHHPQIEKVYYPGLPSHPQHELAKRQMKRGYGGMVSIVVKGGKARTLSFLKALNYFVLAKSLGGVESLSNHAATMTHGGMPVEVREKLGISDGLVRLSVGIENFEDLRDDLEQALN